MTTESLAAEGKRRAALRWAELTQEQLGLVAQMQKRSEGILARTWIGPGPTKGGKQGTQRFLVLSPEELESL